MKARALVLLSISLLATACAGRLRSTRPAITVVEEPGAHCVAVGTAQARLSTAQGRPADRERVLGALRDHAAQLGATHIVAPGDAGSAMAYRCDEAVERDVRRRARILRAHPEWRDASAAALAQQRAGLEAQTAGAATMLVAGGVGVVSGLAILLTHVGKPAGWRPCLSFGSACGGARGNNDMKWAGGVTAGAGTAVALAGLTWLLVTEHVARPLRALRAIDERLSLDVDVGPSAAMLRFTGAF